MVLGTLAFQNGTTLKPSGKKCAPVPPIWPTVRHIKFLLAAVARKAASLECSICLEEAAAPIYGCAEYHLVCEACRGKVASCPTCRQEWGGEGPRRNRFAEERAEELAEPRRELEEATS